VSDYNNISPDIQGAPVIKCLRKTVPSGIFDVHLMVSHPDQWVTDMAEAGTDAFTFHLETTSDGVNIEETINAVKAAGMKVGLALKPGTSVELVFPFVELLDQVLIMTVEPVSE
jgi:ribulose-phosphate 3-epimerase